MVISSTPFGPVTATVALLWIAACAACNSGPATVSTGSAPPGPTIAPAAPPQPPIAPQAGGRGREADLLGSPAWSRSFRGAELERGYSRRLDLLVDPSGNVFLVGDFKGGVDLGSGRLESAGQGDLLLAKFDAEGHTLWSERFGDEADQIYAGAALDPDGNVLLTGVFNGSLDLGDGPRKARYLDMFLAKLDPDGKPLWSKRFSGDGTSQWASAVAAGSDGSVILTGDQEGTIDYGGLSLETHGLALFMVKFDGRGRPQWGKTFGGSVDQEAVGVGVDARGDVVLGGNAKRIVIDGVSLPGKGMMDIFLARWSAAGELRSAGLFGSPEDQLLSSLTLAAGGDAILGGTFRNTLDFRGAPLSTRAPNSYEFFVAKLDRTGEALYSRSFPTGGAVAADGAGNVVIAGSFEGTTSFGGAPLWSAGGRDIFVARLRADGEHLSSFRAGDALDQRATAVAVDRGGRVLLLGTFDGTLDLGSGPMKSESGRDLFLARLPP